MVQRNVDSGTERHVRRCVCTCRKGGTARYCLAPSLGPKAGAGGVAFLGFRTRARPVPVAPLQHTGH
eukprot:2095214-Alexandrium_andersonii.AAC.1